MKDNGLMRADVSLRCISFKWFLFLLSLLLPIRSVGAEQSIQRDSTKCGLYLAPSTIPGAGLGLFVGEDKKPGDIVGPGDVSVPLIDMSYHRGREEFFSMFEHYTWSGEFFGMGQESLNAEDVYAHSPGLDSAINCNLALINVGRAFPEFDIGTVTRYTSPGAGAFSPYFNGTTIVEEWIPVGGELFKDYGKEYFNYRKREYGIIPFVDDYEEAEEICVDWFQMNMNEEARNATWTLIKDTPRSPRVAKALPETPELARQVALHGIRSIHQPKATRSLEELDRDGRCQDNIRHGPSTIRDAARGAFATRPIKKDAILSGSPVLHIPRREFTYMYKFDLVDGEWVREISRRAGSQIVLNYCWGHVDSTILLCPYGTGVNFINHNQTQANVKVQWAPHGMMGHNDTWLKLAHKNMYNYKVSLAIDYVALRDIEEGEELFLDYGDAWEAAWTEHVRSWEPLEEWKDYKPAAVWNKEMANEPILTVEEQMENPYPKNIRIICHDILRYNEYEQLLEDAGDDMWHVQDKTYGIDCKIKRRYWKDEREEVLYHVEFAARDADEKVIGTMNIWDLPRKIFLFEDTFYSTDIHLLDGFRYPAQLPEEMVPEVWRNDVGGEWYAIQI